MLHGSKLMRKGVIMHSGLSLKNTCRGLAGAWLLCLGVPALAAVPSSAEVVSITGKGESRAQANAPWTPAQAKQLLYPGTFVRTLDDSSMALLFSDKTQLRLSRNSMFEIKGVGDGKTSDTTVSLLKGKSWMQSKSVPDKLRMETPSGAAGIHGTDWVMEVDDDGRTTLTVLSGEVEFSNDQGSVRVRANEQSVATPGSAPQKRVVLNPRERVQWVTASRVDPGRYPELAAHPALPPVRLALAAGDSAHARRQLEALLGAGAKGSAQPAGLWLLASDFAWVAGEADAAARHLAMGAARHPSDDRFAAQRARLSLLTGDWDAARQALAAGLQTFPDSPELALLAGELARLDGHGEQALAALRQVTRQAPQSWRGWHELGVTLAERQDWAPARAALQRATELAPAEAGPWADLALLETAARRWPQAQAALDRALGLRGDDIAAWSGQGQLLLSQGQSEAALESILKAGLLEPRYARAQLQAAIAWTQQGRPDAAQTALGRAKALDPNDPLPYFYEAQIQRDALDPAAAITAARAALQRFPYLKSLGPIANDRQGNANLGAAYALAGMETWARRMAMQTQHPFFAGSHLFMAERTIEPWLKNSALIQGYLNDPAVFGASPQRSTLMPVPGAYVAAELGLTHAQALSSTGPSLIANGYRAAPVPMSGFIQLDAPQFRSGDIAFDARSPGVTAALGVLPHEQLSVLVYHDEFRPRVERVALRTASDRIEGDVSRSDLGLRWQAGPNSALWLHAGSGDEQTDVASNVAQRTSSYHRTESDQGLRWTTRNGHGEWALGWEGGRIGRPNSATALGTINRTTAEGLLEGRGERLYLSWRHSLASWQFQADLDHSRYDLEKTSHTLLTSIATGRSLDLVDQPVSEHRRAWSPRLGVAWSPQPAHTYRLAWQDLVRPAAAVSLAPGDTAGIGLDVPGLQPGGRLQRWRAQGEWELDARSYLLAFADRRDIHNLTSPDGQVLNPVASMAQYDRLRQQGLGNALAPEALEGDPVFASGIVRTQGVVYERMATDRLSVNASFIHASTENRAYPGVPLPYFAKYALGLGLTWFAPQRWVVQVRATRRTQRYADDRGTSVLDPDWDVSLRATWQDPAKRHLLEFFARGLSRRDDTASLGLRAVWRY